MRPKGYRFPRVRQAACAVVGHDWKPEPAGIKTCQRCKTAYVPVGLELLSPGGPSAEELLADYPDKRGRE